MSELERSAFSYLELFRNEQVHTRIITRPIPVHWTSNRRGFTVCKFIQLDLPSHIPHRYGSCHSDLLSVQ